MRACDCHGKNHHEASLTLIPPDYMNGDPTPSMPGAPGRVVYCPQGLRERERRHRALARSRRAMGRAAA